MPSQEHQPTPNQPSHRHRSFLVRCWSEGGEQEGAVVWRFSVRTVRAEPTEHVLSSLGQLVDFLMTELTDSGGEV